MKIHHLANIIPEMSPDEYERLRDDIKAHGLNEEIWTYQGKIIDGRHRYRACKETGTEPRFKEYTGNTPASFVLGQNKRRNLTSSQWAMVVSDLEPKIFEEEGRPAQQAGRKKGGETAGRGRPKQIACGPHGPQANSEVKRSRDKVAESVPTSGRQVARAKSVKEKAPDVAQDVLLGKKTLSQAEREVKRREKAEELKAKAEAAKKQHGDIPECKIICGDCLVELPKLSTARLVFTDPPYNIGIDYGGGKKADELPRDRYLAWCDEWIVQCVNLLADDGSMWVMICDDWAEHFADMLNDAGLHRRAWIKWYETFGTNRANNFNRTSRHIFYYVVNPKKFVFNADAVTRRSDRQEKYNDKRADPAGKIRDDVWIVPRLTDNNAERQPGFPTQIPEQITDWIVGCCSDPGDLVVDPFAGSGTTGVSCRKIGRRFIGIERNQDFADRAQVRIVGTEVRV